MRALFDTSVLVAAMVTAHPMHDRARPWLARAKDGRCDLALAAHSLAEAYAVLSTLPVRPRISPRSAWQLVRENTDGVADIVTLTAKEYAGVLERLARASLGGGVVYDGLIARCAQKARVDRLLTLNPADFVRAWPDGVSKIESP